MRFIIFLMVLLLLPLTVWGIASNVVVHQGSIYQTEYIHIQNPDAATITVNIYDSSHNLIWTANSTNTTINYDFARYGVFSGEIVSGGFVINSFTFTIGSVFNSGFKSLMQKVFGTNMYLLGITVLFGIGIFTVTIGRYAGLPILLVALGILALNNFIPSWLIIIIILLGASVFAVALYRFLSLGGG